MDILYYSVSVLFCNIKYFKEFAIKAAFIIHMYMYILL